MTAEWREPQQRGGDALPLNKARDTRIAIRPPRRLASRRRRTVRSSARGRLDAVCRGARAGARAAQLYASLLRGSRGVMRGRGSCWRDAVASTSAV